MPTVRVAAAGLNSEGRMRRTGQWKPCFGEPGGLAEPAGLPWGEAAAAPGFRAETLRAVDARIERP